MFNLNWNLYNKTPWDYLREYKEEKVSQIGTNEKPTPEQLKHMIENDLTDEERREYFDLQKSKDLEAQNKELKRLKKEHKEIKYEYLEKGREFGNYEGIYGMTMPFIGQRQHHSEKFETFEKQKEENKLHLERLINMTPIEADSDYSLIEDLMNKTVDGFSSLDGTLFNTSAYKKRVEDIRENEKMQQKHKKRIKAVKYDIELLEKAIEETKEKKDKKMHKDKIELYEEEIKGHEVEIEAYEKEIGEIMVNIKKQMDGVKKNIQNKIKINKDKSNRDPLDVLRRGVNIGSKGTLFIGPAYSTDAFNESGIFDFDNMHDSFTQKIEEYNKLYQIEK